MGTTMNLHDDSDGNWSYFTRCMRSSIRLLTRANKNNGDCMEDDEGRLGRARITSTTRITTTTLARRKRRRRMRWP
jgi:hypothetical protein